MIAKDYGMTAQAMNQQLHNLYIQFKKGERWYLYDEYADHGYTTNKSFLDENNRTFTRMYWTQKGRKFIYDKLKEYGIRPVLENQTA